MTVEPLAIDLGAAKGYLIPAADRVVLIDAGSVGADRRLFPFLEARGIPPAAIRLIVVTHVHYDHVGGLSAIAERSGAPVMVHRAEASLLATGTAVAPKGLTLLGRLATAIFGNLTSLGRYSPYEAAFVVDNETSLADFGLDAKVLHTPGHTAGSLTVLLAGGEAFVGDLCISHLPFRGGSVFPPFGEDREAIYANWQRLLEAGATRIFPAHGRPFPAEVLRAEIARRR